MLTLKNFKQNIRPAVMQRAREYFNNGRVSNITRISDGYTATVKGTERYEVEIYLDGERIVAADCDCPYDYGGLCKHIAAVLLAIEKRQAPTEKTALSSSETRALISEYRTSAANDKKETDPSENIRITPLFNYDDRRQVLEVSLEIGIGRMYKVQNIAQLYDNFQKENYVEYGKSLAFTHRTDRLDERSRALLKIIGTAFGYYYSPRHNIVYMAGLQRDDLFELYRDDYVTINGDPFKVKFENPELKLTIGRGEKMFTLSANQGLSAMGAGRRSYFMDAKAGIIYAADPRFTRAAYKLYETVSRKDYIKISESDMPDFYSAVLKKAAPFLTINGLELIEKFIPPELTTQLYVDCGDNNTIYADLMFCYDNATFNAFASMDASHYDETAEDDAKSAVLRYFSVCPGRDHRTLLIAGDDTAYDFIVKGLDELSRTMELYVSDKFRRMAVRPPAAPKLGVRVSGGLLELDISDDNYSRAELADILKAYRLGVKYHRLKDGSFALIDNSLAKLNEITENLDLSGKDIEKKELKVPAYRMLYLSNLKEKDGVRMQFAENFKDAVSEYHRNIENADMSVPEELDGIMRDYQKYGFRWLKTIAAYKFGGILADDMGLGKTLQAISLILDMNKSADGQTNKKTRRKPSAKNKKLPALIVCPSSLTLNWESEFNRFAPSLKTLVVIGAAATRKAQIESIPDGGFDAVITSYALITRDIEMYSELKFGLQFIDEAQYIKNHNTQAARAVKEIKSQVRFALTGTPIENTLAELWSAFDFIMPGYLFNYTRFKKTFESPIVGRNDQNAVASLQSSVAPFILRRLKKDVLDELPDKTETVLSTVMEGEQRKLYAANVSELKNSIMGGLGDRKTDRVKILAALTRLREICCDPSLVYENFKGKSAKLEQCAELVESCVNSGHKILLFSQFTSMLDIIAKRLEEMNVTYYTLQGDTRARDRIRLVNEFNENDVKVFLISLKAGGTGLNLTGADIVIHYDPWWNSSAENQASDRAYRIGQKKNVQVYKLITRSSIEENIIRLQQSKSELSELIYGKTADITKMSANEILKLIE